MKNTFAKSIGFTCLAIMMIVSAHNFASGQEKQQLDDLATTSARSGTNGIVGAWETTVYPRNCQTGEQVAPSFQGLITFNKGGTLAEFGANPATPFRTPGHGTWQEGWRGDDSYFMVFSFIPLTPAGVPVGRLKVTQTIEHDRYTDVTSSSGSFRLTNPAGIVIGSGCSTSTAVRLR